MVLPAAAPIALDGDRLMTQIQQLAQIGKLPNGGVQRLAFSAEDCLAREQVKRWMAAAGMTVRVDAAGNVIGRYPGRFDDAPALVTGSHIDTVPNAGPYDGAYGVLAGIEAVRSLSERDRHLDHPIEVIVFTDEERTMIGCQAIAGQLLPDAAGYRSRDQESVEVCLKRVGGNWAAIADAQRAPAAIAAFVELHVEQGPVLTTQRQQIGVVTGIVGQRRYEIAVVGQASHAGTTPMPLRQDALVAASQIVLAVNRIGNQVGDQVATVGRLNVFPNVPNCIPGKVTLSLDVRDLSSDRLDALMVDIQTAIRAIAADTATAVTLTPQLRTTPVEAKSHIQHAIAAVCDDLALRYGYLPSRASHDAQEMAHITDVGMIFVPSEGGISHAETEYTAPEDCINGATVLLQTLLRLDQHYSCPGQ